MASLSEKGPGMNLRRLLRTGATCIPLLAAAPMVLAAPPAAEPIPEFTPPPDIFEPLNRAMFGFNRVVVAYVVDPAAHILRTTTPAFVQRTAGNIYENLREPEFIFTNLLAGHLNDAYVSAQRLAVNTTVGIGGAFDVATAAGMKRRSTEFSEATCAAGIPPGPYLVLPVVGPASAYSAGLLAAAMATEWQVLSLFAAVLVETREIIDDIMDMSVSAASLRHVRDMPGDGQQDAYADQQQHFWDYVKAGCHPAEDDPAPRQLPGHTGAVRED